MKRTPAFIIALLATAMFIGCGMTESGSTTDAESAIMKVIAEDASLKAEGLDNIENESLDLFDIPLEDREGMEVFRRMIQDSSYVWRFGRSDMAHEREVIVEVEDDTSAQALVTTHITGTFHVRQFDRIWTDEDHWVRGDSVRFSEKPIDMNTAQHVRFRMRTAPNGEERWIPVARTFLHGTAGSSLGIEALEFTGDDTTVTYTDFDTEYFGRHNPLVMPAQMNPSINLTVSNDVADEAELVSARMRRGSDRREHRARIRFAYVETLESGDKVYTREIPASDRPRGFLGTVEVMDMRTLFDHDHAEYSAASLGLNISQQRGGRQGGGGNRP